MLLIYGYSLFCANIPVSNIFKHTLSASYQKYQSSHNYVLLNNVYMFPLCNIPHFSHQL